MSDPDAWRALMLRARDGDGRDPDAHDQGDWNDATECDSPGNDEDASDSSWHGSHVAGTIAAVTNNAKGVAGITFNAKVQPVRVLGRCGGSDIDIAEAIVWAAGGTVPGIPVNTTPAEVINMSLGGGVSMTLRVDPHGKSFQSHVLDMEV